jgi:hypothetical protein
MKTFDWRGKHEKDINTHTGWHGGSLGLYHTSDSSGTGSYVTVTGKWQYGFIAVANTNLDCQYQRRFVSCSGSQ